MNSTGAELASATSTIEDLMARISHAADTYQSAGDETTANELYDVERSLRSAGRRLATLVRRLADE